MFQRSRNERIPERNLNESIFGLIGVCVCVCVVGSVCPNNNNASGMRKGEKKWRRKKNFDKQKRKYSPFGVCLCDKLHICRRGGGRFTPEKRNDEGVVVAVQRW